MGSSGSGTDDESMDEDTSPKTQPPKKLKRDSAAPQLIDLVKSNNTMLQKILKQQKQTDSKLIHLQEENKTQAKKIQILEEKVEFLCKGGHLNLILQGAEEKDAENAKTIAEEVITKTMKINIKLAYAHRIGKKIPNKSRPLLLKLKSNEDKIVIRENLQLLRDFNKINKTAMYINEDAPKSERIRQAQLRKSLKIAKQTDPAAKIKGNFIISKGDRFSIELDGTLTKQRRD
jgi:hypothetical protein